MHINKLTLIVLAIIVALGLFINAVLPSAEELRLGQHYTRLCNEQHTGYTQVVYMDGLVFCVTDYYSPRNRVYHRVREE